MNHLLSSIPPGILAYKPEDYNPWIKIRRIKTQVGLKTVEEFVFYPVGGIDLVFCGRGIGF